MGNLSIRCQDGKTPGQDLAPAPAFIGFDEFQLAIPWRDALQQGRLRFTNRGPVCRKLRLLVEEFSSNGKLSLNCLSHPQGARAVASLPVSLSVAWFSSAMAHILEMTHSVRECSRDQCCAG